jgi:hypothetical protein
MVTPNNESATAIVCLLWVMTMNCASSESSRKTPVNRPMFSSSSGASISSRMQNGVGLIKKLAKSRAIAVKVFSPPESMVIPFKRLPGGCTTISTPGSCGPRSSAVSSDGHLDQPEFGPATGEELHEDLTELLLEFGKGTGEHVFRRAVDALNDFLE